MSSNTMFLYHGLAADSRYLCVLASAIAEAGIANVITPDLSGHGPQLGAKSAFEFKGFKEDQIIQDFEELYIQLRNQLPAENLFIAGHSLGASVALKLATSASLPQKAEALLWAPFLGEDSGTLNKENLRYWIEAESEPEAEANAKEASYFQVHYPEALRTGSEVLRYHRDFFSACLLNEEEGRKQSQLHSVKMCFLGEQDPLFDIPSLRAKFTEVQVLPANHFSLVTDPAVIASQIETLHRIF